MTTSPAPESKRAPAGQAAILAAASAVFAQRGYSGASLSEIAARAGVSKANIHHHFGSKRGLYLAVMQAACARTAGFLTRADGLPRATDPAAVLRAFLENHLQALLGHAGDARLILREMLGGDDTQVRDLAEEVFADYARALVDRVERAQQAGALRQDFDASLLAFVLFAVNSFFFQTQRVVPHIEAARFSTEPATFVAEVFDLLMRGARGGGVS